MKHSFPYTGPNARNQLAHKWRMFTNAGPSRATAGPGETFSLGPQTFSWGPSREKIFEIFLPKMAHSDVFLYF